MRTIAYVNCSRSFTQRGFTVSGLYFKVADVKTPLGQKRGLGTAIKDTALLKQFKAIDDMADTEKNALVSVIFAYIMYHKTKQAYAL